MNNKMPFTIFIFLLITCIIKDVLEIFLGVIPGINFFVWIISIPFVAFIFIIVLISGIRGTWLLAGQILDFIPLLPIATLTVILVYIFQKSPDSVKKKIEKTTKLVPKKSLKSPSLIKV